MLVDRYTTWLLARPRAVVAASVMLTLAIASGAGGLTVTSDMRAYFSPDNPQLAAFEALERVFDRQDSLLFFVVARDGDLFTPARLGLLRDLTDLGWQAPYSRRVDSLTNHQHTRARGDDLVVTDLVPDDVAQAPGGIEAIRAVALAEPALAGKVVSRDGRASGVAVALALPDDDREANDRVVGWARERLAPLRAAHPDVEILIGGTTATNVALGEAVVRDIRSLVTLSYVVIALGLLLLLRHLGGTLATILVVTLSVAATMGTFGWAGWTLAAVAGFVPSVVMTIAVADSVHILVSYYHGLRHGLAKDAAIREALRINAQPVLITSVTTIIGVLTLNFSDSPPYRDLGNMVAVGVLFAYALSMSFLPAALACTRGRHPARGVSLERRMDGFADRVIAGHRPLLLGIGAVVLLLASLIPRNELTERWHGYFDETFEVRRTVDAVDRHLGGLHTVRYRVGAGREDGIHDPRYLADLHAFGDWLLAQPGVEHVARLSDTLARLNRDLHGGDPAWRRLPDSPALAAQLLLLYELSLPQGLGLEHVIDVARSATQMTVLVRRTDSEQLLALDRAARAWAAAHAPSLDVGEGTGVDMVFAHINHRNIRGLLKGMVLALALISLLLVVALRSVKLGLLSLITNLAPAALAYGTWALLVGRIDLSASVVMCMSVGIVVDDTVHFLSKYLRARREQGLDAAGGLRYAFHTVGVALVITTAVLVAGFLVLAASHFNPSVHTGTLLAMTLAYALVVDFLFMPPLLLELDRRWGLRF